MELNDFKNNIPRDNLLIINGVTYDNSDLIGGITYKQSTNVGEDLTLGSCPAASIEFKLNNLNYLINNLQGQEITWIIRAETSPGITEDLQMGVFIAEKPAKINDTLISVKAYDRMVKFDVFIDDWLNGLTYPQTVGQLLSSLCSFVGVTLATTTFMNDNYPVQRSFSGVNITGRQYLKWIGEIAAKYAVMDNQGRLKLGWYTPIVYGINNTNYTDVWVEDYKVKKIDKLQVRVEENDLGVLSGTGTNAYVIQNNPLLYADTEAEIQPYIDLIYNAIKDMTYIPYEITANFNPLVKAGNSFQVTTRKGQVFNAVVMHRTMTRFQDQYSATGNAERKQNVSANQLIQQLRGRTNVLTRTLEGTISQLYDASTGDITTLAQTVNSFNTRVSSLEENQNYQYMQDTAPVNPSVGDVWFSTAGNVFIVDNLLMTVDQMTMIVDYYDYSLNRTYRWDGTIWVHVEDGAITALRENVSEIDQTVDAIGLSVSSYDGRIGTLELTANSLASRISNAEGDMSTLEQTATSLTSTVLSHTSTLNSQYTQITQLSDSINLKATVGDVVNYLEINQTGVQISAANIDLTGITTIYGAYSGDYVRVNNGRIDLYADGDNALRFSTSSSGGTIYSPSGAAVVVLDPLIVSDDIYTDYDMYVSDDLDVGGRLYVDGIARFYNDVYINGYDVVTADNTVHIDTTAYGINIQSPAGQTISILWGASLG